MGQNYISEIEASELAGVSSTTLARFVEAGYLKVETNSEGSRTYSRNELSEIFGITARPANPSQNIPAQSENIVPLTEESIDNLVKQAEPQSLSSQIDVISEEPIEPLDIPEPVTIVTQAAPEIRAEVIETAKPDNSEVIRLRSLVKMYERIIELREQENTELKKDRDWLRGRIERHEEKSDRDQLLLLSETQMIRKLVTINQEGKTSVFRAALEWFGLVPPKEKPSLAIGNSGTIQHGIVNKSVVEPE